MLAIEWTNKQIRVVEGTVTGETVKVNDAFSVDLPESVEGDQADQVGFFIRSELNKRGIKERRGVACVDRRNVILKVVSVANIAESEIANTVRLQAMRDLTLPLEETTVDYVQAHRQSDFEEPQVVLAVVRNEIVSSYQRVFKAAGLRLEGIWPASLAHVRAAMSSMPTMITHAGEEHFLIVPSPDLVELSLLRGTRFLTSASRPVSRPSPGGTEAESFLQSVRRLQASLSGQYSELKIQTVFVAGVNADPALHESLTDQFGAEVVYFDPLRSFGKDEIYPLERGSYAGVVGSLVLAARPDHERINFLVPKQPKPKADYRRIGLIAGVGIVVLALLLGQRFVAGQTDDLDKAIKVAKKKRSDRDKSLKQLRLKSDQLAWIQDWRERTVVWPNLLRELFEVLPEADKLFLTRLEMVQTNNREDTKAVLQMEGFADDSKTILDLNDRLSKELQLLVDPGAIQPATRFAGYNWRYSANVTIPEDWSGGVKMGIPAPLPAPVPRNSTDALDETEPSSSVEEVGP